MREARSTRTRTRRCSRPRAACRRARSGTRPRLARSCGRGSSWGRMRRRAHAPCGRWARRPPRTRPQGRRACAASTGAPLSRRGWQRRPTRERRVGGRRPPRRGGPSCTCPGGWTPSPPSRGSTSHRRPPTSCSRHCPRCRRRSRTRRSARGAGQGSGRGEPRLAHRWR